MGGKYIVRQQIKNVQGATIGYEILYQEANSAFEGTADENASDYAAADAVYSFLTQNTEKVLKGKLNFMTFTTSLLMKKTPKLFDKEDLVIQIDDSVTVHPLSMHFVRQYAKEGYKIAINEFQFSPRYLSLLDCVDYIKINMKQTPDLMIRNIVEISHSLNRRCIATHIENEALYQKAVAFQIEALEGPYVSELVTTKAHSGAYLQSNFFRLMVAISEETPDINQIEEIISADASLSYGIMKIANSAYFALRTRAKTIHQAIMTLGLAQLRQWIYLLSTNDDAKVDEQSEEFLKRSFTRANFCSELMNYAQNMPISKSEAYLMGMFSTLNYLIDSPLEEILSEIPIAEEIKEALLYRQGRCGILYELVISYEAADWEKITSLSAQLGIPDQMITNIYFLCMENVNSLWEQLSSGQYTE